LLYFGSSVGSNKSPNPPKFDGKEKIYLFGLESGWILTFLSSELVSICFFIIAAYIFHVSSLKPKSINYIY